MVHVSPGASFRSSDSGNREVTSTIGNSGPSMSFSSRKFNTFSSFHKEDTVPESKNFVFFEKHLLGPSFLQVSRNQS